MFCLQRSPETSREQLAIINAARRLGYDYCFANECKEGLIPIGDVPFCEAVFGLQPLMKCFYPNFLRTFMRRHVEGWFQETRTLVRTFAKDATHWKCDFAARIFETGEMLPRRVLLLSDVVEFSDEWRYYVADGDLVATGWYQGDNEDSPAPRLDIKWPRGFSGAVDFGLVDGELTLVESHAPFACGWYGDDPELFALWQMAAWENRDFWLSVE